MTHTNNQESPPGNDDGPGTGSEAITATATKRIDTTDDTDSTPKPPPARGVELMPNYWDEVLSVAPDPSGAPLTLGPAPLGSLDGTVAVPDIDPVMPPGGG